jgi:outer membrane protein TolC
MLRLPTLLLTLTLAGGSWAQAAPDEPAAAAGGSISPAEAVEIALANHPGLRAAEEEVVAAEADRDLAGGGYLPRIELSEDWLRSDNAVFAFSSKLLQGIFGPEDFDVAALNDPDPITNSTTRISVYQNIWSGGRTGLQKRAATSAIAAAESSAERTRNEVVYGALESYWDLSLAGEMLRVTRDAETASQANLALTRELVDAGLAVPSDRLSAEVRLAEVQAMRIRAEYGVEVAHAALLRALGLETAEPRFQPIEIAERPVADGDSLEQRLDQAFAERADLMAMEHRLEQAEVGGKLARSGYYPEIGALGRYEWNGSNLFGADGENWTIGLSARFMIFDGNGRPARTRRARAELARAEAIHDGMRQGIRLEVQAAWAERESARRRLDVAEVALDRAEEALRIVRERYQEGLALVVELLGAEAAFTRARADRAAALSDLWLAAARLDLASGADPLQHQIPTPNPDNDRS